MLPMGRKQGREDRGRRFAWRDWRPTMLAAGLSGAAVAVLVTAFDSVSPYERGLALQSLTNSVFWIAAALIGSCGTIAALMLTTVSLMEHLDTRRMGPRFLIHMRLTVLGALATIGCAVGALLLTIFPFATGVEVRPPTWQVNVVFYGLQGLTALMVGGFSVVLSSLYATIADVFGNLPESWVEEIMTEEEEEEAEREEEAEEQEQQAATRARRRDAVGASHPAGQRAGIG